MFYEHSHGFQKLLYIVMDEFRRIIMINYILMRIRTAAEGKSFNNTNVKNKHCQVQVRFYFLIKTKIFVE